VNTVTKPPVLVGCGILSREIEYLIAKNGWTLDCDFLPSSLHMDLNALARELTSGLERNNDRSTIVFYGCCHPLMDHMLSNAKTLRTCGRNCIEILLGTEVYDRELKAGAFFLLDDWAWKWDDIMTSTFGHNRAILAEIMQLDRKYLLAVRTPCSRDFSEPAEIASRQTGLPLRWLDVGLDHLESVLVEAIARKQAGHA
jgi:hypothetical protein